MIWPMVWNTYSDKKYWGQSDKKYSISFSSERFHRLKPEQKNIGEDQKVV
jgi:hypothetical protein